MKPTTMSYNSASIYCSEDLEEKARKRAEAEGLKLSEWTRKLWRKELGEDGEDDDE